MADDRLGGRRTRRPRDTAGRVPFIWVQDDDTGHRYDVLATAIRAGMAPVEGVPPNYSGRARSPKHRTDLASLTPAPTPDTRTTAGDTTTPQRKGAKP